MTLSILKDGFTVAATVYHAGDTIDDTLLGDAVMTPREQRRYYGEQMYQVVEEEPVGKKKKKKNG